LVKWPRSARRRGVAQVGLSEQDVWDTGGYEPCTVFEQRGFVGDSQNDQMAAFRGAIGAAGLVGRVRSLYQLLRQRQVRADQDVGVGFRLARCA